MSSTWEITIALSDDTWYSLTQTGSFKLAVLKAVQCNGGQPVACPIWCLMGPGEIYLYNYLIWSDQYKTFTNGNSGGLGIVISPANPPPFNLTSYSMSLGQTLKVTKLTGTNATGDVEHSGLQSAITIQNALPAEGTFSTGMSQNVVATSNPKELTETNNPVCGVFMPPNAVCQIAPLEKVLLFFATTYSPAGGTLEVGTILDQVPFTTQCGALFVDLTESNTRALSFDFNNGWATSPTPGATWAQSVAAGTTVGSLLFQSTSPEPIV